MSYELERGEGYNAYLVYNADKLLEPLALKPKDKIKVSTVNILTGEKWSVEAESAYIFPMIELSGRMVSTSSKISKEFTTSPSVSQPDYYLLLEEAEKLFRTKSYNDCIECCKRIQEIYFFDAWTFMLKSVCYYNLKDLSKAFIYHSF